MVAFHNRTFDEIAVGEIASLIRVVKPEDIKLFTTLMGGADPPPWVKDSAGEIPGSDERHLAGGTGKLLQLR